MKALRWNSLIVSLICVGALGCSVPAKSGETGSVLAALEAEDISISSLLEHAEPGPLVPANQAPLGPPDPSAQQADRDALRALMKRINLERPVTRVGGQGQLDTLAIATVFRRRRRAVSVCYHLVSRDAPGLHGRVGVRFTVDANGRFTAVTVTENTTESESLADCITRRLERFRAPKPEGGVAEFAWSMELPAAQGLGE